MCEWIISHTLSSSRPMRSSMASKQSHADVQATATRTSCSCLAKGLRHLTSWSRARSQPRAFL